MELDRKLELNRDYVTYEDFGAVGDGKTEDFGAIYKTHEYANAHGLTVKGTPGKTYYIKDTTLGTEEVQVAKIKTNVDWCGANFVIDDTELTVMRDYSCRKMALESIFEVVPDDEHMPFRLDDPTLLSRIAEQGLNQQTKRIDLGLDFDGPVMIIPYNSAHCVFRRRGTGQYNGSPMHEIIVVEADGSISEETPIMFSYKSIDYMDVYKLDPTSAISIKNGVFTTLESRVNHYLPKADGTLEYIYHGYIVRNLHVMRSYTTVENIEHRVSGGFTLLDRAERNLEGAMYHGFFVADDANHVTFKNCIIPGRTSPGPGGGHSSYGFKANHVNKIVLDGCFQPNFWISIDPETYEIKNATVYDENAIGRARKASKDAVAAMGSADVNGIKRRLCWGLGGTNFCKNMEYINSTVTRFDAHAGLYNGKIINCNISGIELTGVGELSFENCNWYQYSINNPILLLRGDYGCHWSGDISVKDVNAYMLNKEKVYIASHSFINWYFGYTCAIPSVSVDNVKFFDQKTEEALAPGFEAHYFKFTEASEKMHLDETDVPAIFSVNDFDGDGYIDEPRFISDVDGTFYPERDLDGDGRIGNTSLKYDDYMNKSEFILGGLARPSHYLGATHPTCTVNLNKIRPPKYFKVVNNTNENGEAVGKYYVKNTVGISDGGWNRDASSPDTMGGFFGNTKFIYGSGDDDYALGTADNATVGEGFVFTSEYDI